ncbi:MAG: phosphoglycerate kinase [Candidatus Moranbacteria bacterium]|nr:phosphoglycerate kinase [Candidatus Moranbacteria bacterium]
MPIRSIEQANFKNKKALVRMDFNVELDNIAQVQEHFKLEVLKKTIDYILGFPGVKVAMLTHFGRPKGKNDPHYSVAKLVPAVEQAFARKVTFVSDCIGKDVVKALDALPSGELLLLENVRFYPEEEANDEEFAKSLAKPFDIYVNEAFGVDHRNHASVTTITKFLPAYAGLHVLEEIEKLDYIRLLPDHPAVAIIGGAKIETKLPLIQALEKNFDAILVGGKVANEAIDQKIVFSEKVLLPLDFDSPLRLDIGPNTIACFIQVIKIAKTIVWNGPLGKFEEKPYDMGTNAILHAILESQAFFVIGGGESLAVLEKTGVMDRIGFVSSGGGAMLEYLSGKKLPGIEALEA